jgi:hypothetical protein
MFLFLLVEYLTLTDKTFDSVLSSNHGNRLLLKFWHRWCSRSKEFAPVWEEFTSTPASEPGLKYGDVECSENPTICARLIGTTYPQVLWFDPEFNATVRFENERTITNLYHFLEEMRLYPFRRGSNLDTVMRSSDPFAPIALLTVPSGDVTTLRLLKRILYRLNRSDRKIVLFDSPRRLQICLGGFRDIVFKGQWAEDELTEFLRTRFMNRLELLTDETWQIFNELRITFVQIFIDPKKKFDDFRHFVSLLPPTQYSYSLFDPDDPFVAKFGVRKLKTPITIFYNTATGFKTIYRGPFTIRDVSEWMSNISEQPPRNGVNVGWFIAAAIIVIVCVVLFIRVSKIKKSAYFGSAGALTRLKPSFP